MMDWKAFEDGSMPQGERDRLHEALQSDEALRSDYEAYRLYVSTLRDQALRQPIPTLEFRLSRPPAIRRPFLVAGGLAGLAAAVLIVGPMLNRPAERVTLGTAFATSSEIARFETNQPEDAAKWLVKHTSLKAPTINAPNEVKFQSASYGMDWAGYDLTCKEGSLKLRFADHDAFESCSTVTLAGNVFYLTNGIGWRQNGLSFLLTGSDGVPLRDYAEIMHREISRSLHLSSAPVRGQK